MKYTSLHGDIIRELYGPVEESLYADLVAALEIARAYQAKCERLERWKAEATDVIGRWEAVYEAAGIDPAGNLGRKKSDLLADRVRWLREAVSDLRCENARLRAELDRYELVS